MPSPALPELPILTTAEPPPGLVVDRVLGACWGVAVRPRFLLGRSLLNFLDLLGGQSQLQARLAEDTRRVALERLAGRARDLGANAVLGLRFDSGELVHNVGEVVAYGTAVVLRPGPGR
jgi:uncharacterized protein YbjQ (UPF0145 family)